MHKYKIGEEVQTNDGNKAFIVGLIMGQTIKRKSELEGRVYYHWDKNCPGWENKAVYYIEFMNPIKPATLKNLIDIYDKMYSLDSIRQMYESQENVLLLTVPEDEIKLANCVG